MNIKRSIETALAQKGLKKKDLANLAMNLSQKQSWTRDLTLKLEKVESSNSVSGAVEEHLHAENA